MTLSLVHSTSAFQKSRRQSIDDVAAAFCGYFQGAGYETVEPEPLIPRNDKSVLFSNATITPLKDRLLADERPETGWVIQQPCLRLQNFSDYPNPDFSPEYMSFFHMVGVFAPDLSTEYAEHLLKALEASGVSPEQLELRGCYRDADMMAIMRSVMPEETAIETCGRFEGYFDWKYDMEGYRGRGFHIMIKQPEGPALSIGQVVEISENNHVVGYEFGFGCETFLSRCLGTDSIFTQGLFVDSCGKASDNIHRQYYDTLTSAIAMSGSGVTPGKGGRASVLRKALRNCAVFEQVYGCQTVTNEEIQSLSEAVSKSLPDGSFTPSAFNELLDSARERLANEISRFHDYVHQRSLSEQRGDTTPEYSRAKITGYARKLHVPELVLHEALNALSNEIEPSSPIESSLSS